MFKLLEYVYDRESPGTRTGGKQTQKPQLANPYASPCLRTYSKTGDAVKL
jgi:hypothetical protein